MAVYKIFADRDATIYSEFKMLNSGLDAILEVTKEVSENYTGSASISRFLISFLNSDISGTISQKVGNTPYEAFLNLYLAQASELPTLYTLLTFPVSESWDVGTGKFGDSPIGTNGVSWKYRTYFTASIWSTGSTSLSLAANPGGGNWYTSSFASQSFGIYDNKDLSFNVSNIVKSWISGTIVNNGFIVMLSGSEFNNTQFFSLKYFSRDTNTIYPPTLEIRWDDSSWSTGSFVTASDDDIMMVIDNNVSEFDQNDITRFRLTCRDRFPTRMFSTSSIYTTRKLLPSMSYYAIKDMDTDIMVVDFDNNYTKISADSAGNFFDVYMYGLEPERHYRIIIKSLFNGRPVIYDNNHHFKIKK